MPTTARLIKLPDAAATDRLAARLAPLLRAGDCLLLSGPMGAGKSHLARGIIQTLQSANGPVEDVPSPTYTLVQTYRAGGLEIVHADLYRLGDPDEIVELGLEDAFGTALCLVEWPERLGSAAPETALRIVLEPDDAGRRLRLDGPAEQWGARLCALGGVDD